MRTVLPPRLVQFLVRCAALCACLAPALAWAGPPWATDPASAQSTYLQPGDFPSTMEASGDWAQATCDGPSEISNGCSFSGKKLWTATDASAPVWQVHDIRWVFPDADAAERFLQAEGPNLSENNPPVSQPPAVGQSSKMFTLQGDPMGLGMDFYMYNLIFRVDNVAVKIFVSQGPQAETKSLTPLQVAALGQKAADRIRRAEPNAVAPTPVAAEPEPSPVSDEYAAAAPEPEPEPEPESRRERRRSRDDSGSLREEVKEYWSDKIDKPFTYVGGGYSAPIGSYVVPNGNDAAPGVEKVTPSHGIDVILGGLLHPRIFIAGWYRREVWEVPDVQEVIVSRLEILYGLDLIALPPAWRVRPALMALIGFGLGWGHADSLLATPDPMDPMPRTFTPTKGIGIGGFVGGDFALHFRLGEKFELAPYAGVTLPSYAYSSDFMAESRKIDGERGFGRAPRWAAGLRIGFGGEM